MTSMNEMRRRTRLMLVVAALLAGSAACFGRSEAGEGAQGDSADVAATAGAAGEHADTEESIEVVVLDTTQQRLGGIVVEPVATITTSGLAVTGTITYDANRVSHVGARTEGRVVALRAELGARVGRGQTLALLESADVGQIRAEEREAEELVKIAEENFAREKRLAAQGISSRKELLEAEAELRRMQASLRSAETRMQVLGAGHGTGGQFGVTAPFAGQVVARDASLGEMAGPEDTLFTVADLSRVWIELDVFERDLARVRVGQPVVVTTTAYPQRTFPGRIVYVGDILDPMKRTVRARVQIPNTDGALKPGMFATANIQIGAGSAPRVVLPLAAVQEVNKRTVVFIPGAKPGEFRATPVELGDSLGDGRVVILSGVQAGQRVVVAGAFTLRSELAKGEIGDEH